ncbi:ATP-dependent DNA helicase PIF1-like protein [Tanacetum coccineum]
MRLCSLLQRAAKKDSWWKKTLLKRCKLIIWDEAPMANKLCFEALDHSLRDILRKNRYDTCPQPFGNMTMVFGSGFGQLWDNCNVLKLTANMRLTVGARPEDVTEIQEFTEDAVELTEFEDVDINEKVEKEKQQIGNEESSSQMDQDFVNPSLNEDDKVGHSSHATGVDSVIKEDVDINENVEKEKEEIGNEESNSQMDHVSVNTSLNEDDKVVDDSVTTIPDSVTEGTREKLIKNDNVLVDDVLHPIVKCSFEELKIDSLNECDVVILDGNKANVQDSVERSEHSLEKEKNKISNEKFRSQSLKDNVGAEAINDNVKVCNLVAGDSQHTLEDKTKEGKFN